MAWTAWQAIKSIARVIADAKPCRGFCGGVKLDFFSVGLSGTAGRWAPGTVIPRPPAPDPV